MRPQGPSTPFALRGLRVALAGALALATMAAAARAADAPKPAAAAPAAAPKSEPDDLRLAFLVGEQIDRLNPGTASSDNPVATGSITLGAEFDFRVAVLPVSKKGPNPALSISGRMVASDRALGQSVPIPGDTTGRDTLQVIPAASTLEMAGAMRLAYPVYVRRGEAVTYAYLKAEVATVFARDTRTAALDVRTYALGFERANGNFAGSFVDFGYGRDAAFGDVYGAKRYKVHVLIMGAISPATSGRRGNLAAFADFDVSTDNQGGPEGVRAMVGLRLDSDGLLRGVSGLIGGLLGT
jgi:hypothetical protein